MKILAIRGCNLASLAGEFEIDLSRAPFADTGVFAIVGNTGAGKSTLLDALCVALFDRTPRLTNHSRVTVGRGDDDPASLGAHDARTLLRRGSSAGYAEVDFESGDARRYRARWSVRRARNQTDGTLQDQTLSLVALDGHQRLGGTKTETLKAIASCLGLSFDQFRRSALLAQGDFAAFLRADGKDRSELLERMTGTEIYSRLSVAAHLRASLAEQRLRDTRAAALAIPVLEDGARLEAEADRSLADGARRASRTRLEIAEAAARWLAEAGVRERALVGARGQHREALAALATAASDRDELSLRQRAEKLRAPFETVERLERELGAARAGITSLEELVSQSAAARAASAERLSLVRELHAPIQTGRVAAGLREPGAIRAAVDRVHARADAGGSTGAAGAAISSVHVGANAASSSVHVGATDASSGDVGVDTASSGVAAGVGMTGDIPGDPKVPGAAPSTSSSVPNPTARSWNEVLSTARAALLDATWLVAHNKLANDIAGWRSIDDRFAEHESVAAAIAVLDRTLAVHDANRLALAASRALVATDHRGAVAALGEAQRGVSAFHERRGPTLDAARKLEDEARVRVADSVRLVGITQKARGAVDERDAIDARLAELTAAASQDRDRGDELAIEIERARVLRDERMRALDELRRAAGYTHARAELHDGEPCPLCGALEHPWRDRGALDQVVASAQASLDEVIASLATRAHETAALSSRAEQRDRERSAAETRRGELVTTIASASTEWRAHLATLGELILDDVPSTPGAAQLATDRVLVAARQLEAARTARHQTEAAAKAAADAQAAVQLAQATVDQLAARLVELERSVSDLEATSQRVRGERAGRVERIAQLEGSLAEMVQRWRLVDRAASSNTSTSREGSLRATPQKPLAPVPNGADGSIESSNVSGLGRRADGSLTSSNAASSGAGANALAIHSSVQLGEARSWMAGLVADWAARGSRVALAEAALADLLARFDVEIRDLERAAAEHATRLIDARHRTDELVTSLSLATAQLDTAAIEQGFGAEQRDRESEMLDKAVLEQGVAAEHRERSVDARVRERLRGVLAGGERIDEITVRLAAIDAAVVRARAIVEEREQLVVEHEVSRPVDGALADALDVDSLARVQAEAESHLARAAATLAADADARSRREAALAAITTDEQRVEIDRVLGGVIGSHDGKLFRSFAQSLTLDALLAVANSHLDELAPRYQLERIPRHDLEIQVIDRDLGEEVRSVQSLSGGEGFLVSLALALGLSSMSAHDVRVRTLLIDEGFGTLDPATLDGALAVLDTLQATGRQIGVISHVPALVERVGAHVRVVQRGGGRSEVVVRA